MSDYISRVRESLSQRYSNQPEYLQSVLTWLDMIAPALEDSDVYERLDLLTRMVEPERMLSFTVPWVDDAGYAHTCHGYRAQFNSAIGPYKGGLRFHPSVNPSIVKFLGFEQTYKNALTGLPIGGAAGGADFDPRGKSKREVMRFCQSFMMALYRHIGADTDIPAGDIGVGSREIGFLYGEYKRLTGQAESSALTGKGLTYGGSVIRQEAAGFGTVYFIARMLEHQGETMEGKRLAVSGFGNMAWGVCRKSAELGGKVVTLSGPDGYIYDPDGVATQEKFDFHAPDARQRPGHWWSPTPSASAWSFTPAKSPGRCRWTSPSPAPPRTSWTWRTQCASWPTTSATTWRAPTCPPPPRPSICCA